MRLLQPVTGNTSQGPRRRALTDEIPIPTVPLLELACGNSASCGVTYENEYLCWEGPFLDFFPVEPELVHGLSMDSTAVAALRLEDDHPTFWGGIPAWLAWEAPDRPVEMIALERRIETDDACVIYKDGGLHCWGGSAEEGQVPPEGMYQFVTIAHSTACAIRDDGSPVCWIPDPDGHIDQLPLFNEPLVTLALGVRHGCALTASGHIRCWGKGKGGRLGVPAPPSEVP
ncbi:MAG: hypothetical protein H6739_15050 [Alphaproteobacteria bacterium]|nr:hypothetical protein [Alphaproteobacteria bacterium]